MSVDRPGQRLVVETVGSAPLSATYRPATPCSSAILGGQQPRENFTSLRDDLDARIFSLPDDTWF
jgi:hypothetical protein